MRNFPICRETANLALRESFSLFLRFVFRELNPSEALSWNWHIDAMCHGLHLVRTGEEQRLVITIPPRHLKSITVSVAYVAWAMGHDPSLKFVVASYGGELAMQLARDFKRVVTAKWFKRAFPAFGTPVRNADGELVTSKGGYRKAVSVGGAVTGFGADYIVVDDLMKASDATSAVARETAIEFYQQSLISRLNDQERGRIIVIAQRLHEDDVPGRCLETGLFRHLNLPAIAQRDEVIPLGGGRTHVRRIGDVLAPERQSREVLERMKLEIGAQAFAAQYLQDPTPAESDYLTWSKIPRYDQAPSRKHFLKVVQSWDTAEVATARADYSVCTTWGYYDGRWYLLHLERFRAGFLELKDRVRAHRNHWKPDLILIEDAGSGRHLLEELRLEIRTRGDRATSVGYKVVACKPSAAKHERWAAQAARLESGLILFPREEPWIEALRREITAFPNGRNDDQVDSISQFAHWLSWGATSRNLTRAHNEKAHAHSRRRPDPHVEDDENPDAYWFQRGR